MVSAKRGVIGRDAVVACKAIIGLLPSGRRVWKTRQYSSIRQSDAMPVGKDGITVPGERPEDHASLFQPTQLIQTLNSERK